MKPRAWVVESKRGYEWEPLEIWCTREEAMADTRRLRKNQEQNWPYGNDIIRYRVREYVPKENP